MIEVRNARTGALVSSVTPGRARDVALTPTTVAVLLRGRIARYSVATGEPLGSTPVPVIKTPVLDSAGERIVFEAGRSIHMLDARTGRLTTLATAPRFWTASLARIDGRTVMWAESRRVAQGEVSRRTYRSRIRMLVLPAA